MGEGFPGADGKDGKDGKDGVNKTVIVHADGKTEEVPSLPETGNETNYWALTGAAAVLLAVGTTSVVVARRRK
jgi:LPXTG-motif cell wall-anchored protein